MLVYTSGEDIATDDMLQQKKPAHREHRRVMTQRKAFKSQEKSMWNRRVLADNCNLGRNNY
jgi:hypothetical protein